MSFVISSVAMIPKDLFKMFVLFLAGSLAKKSRDSAGCNTLCTSKPKPWGNETLADRFKKSKYIRAISTTQKRTYSESWSHGYRNVSWKHVFNIFCRVTYPRNITYCKLFFIFCKSFLINLILCTQIQLLHLWSCSKRSIFKQRIQTRQ